MLESLRQVEYFVLWILLRFYLGDSRGTEIDLNHEDRGRKVERFQGEVDFKSSLVRSNRSKLVDHGSIMSPFFLNFSKVYEKKTIMNLSCVLATGYDS